MSSPFSTHTLDNGLTLVFETIPRIRSAALGFFAQTGSRDEASDLLGISHFLEHMCFKGTPKRDWRQLSLDVDDLGAMWNAYTWWEGTAYFHWVQSDRATDSIEILSDMMCSNLPLDEFNMEKKVILEEIAMYHDQPDALIIDDLIQEAFGDHPLGQSVLGTEDTVKSITRDLMAEYHQRRYGPNNLTFVITGAFDRDEIIRAVEAHCGGWQVSDNGREQSIPTFHASNRVVQRDGVAREHIALALPAPPSPMIMPLLRICFLLIWGHRPIAGSTGLLFNRVWLMKPRQSISILAMRGFFMFICPWIRKMCLRFSILCGARWRI